MTKEEKIKEDPEAKEIRIAYLINGYIRHNLTVTENNELDEWVCVSMKNQQIFEAMTEGLMELGIGY